MSILRELRSTVEDSNRKGDVERTLGEKVFFEGVHHERQHIVLLSNNLFVVENKSSFLHLMPIFPQNNVLIKLLILFVRRFFNNRVRVLHLEILLWKHHKPIFIDLYSFLLFNCSVLCWWKFIFLHLMNRYIGFLILIFDTVKNIRVLYLAHRIFLKLN